MCTVTRAEGVRGAHLAGQTHVPQCMDETESDCKVLMLTTFDLDEYVHAALEVGVSGFLLKDVRRDDLVHGVRVVMAGDALLAPSITRRLIAEYASPARPGVAVDPAATLAAAGDAGGCDKGPRSLLQQLAAREEETLRCIAQGMSNAETPPSWSASTP